jgi:hypothetical protein
MEILTPDQILARENIVLEIMEAKFKRKYAPFQEKIARTIVRNFLKQDGQNIYIEVARQAGKTTAVVDCVSVLSAIAKPNWGMDSFIGVFAPQKEQSKTDFDRVKSALKELQKAGHQNASFEQSNANTITLFGGLAEFYSFSLEEGTDIEGKSNSLQIFEEAQKIHGKREKKMKVEAFPMGAAYNASRIFIGSGGYHLCHFKKGIDENIGNKLVVHRYPYQQVIEEKRWLYEQTGDPFHLQYEKFIEKEKLELGEGSDEFKSQYELIWNLTRGMFVTREAFLRMAIDKPELESEKTYPCFAGIDVGKRHDSSVCSIIRRANGKWVRIATRMWIGDNYSVQFKEMVEFLGKYKVVCLAIDSTGVGDWLPDRFDDETSYEPIHFTFSQNSRDKLYRNALTIFQSDQFRWLRPRSDHIYHQTIKQYTELEKEYKGEYLSVHHPDNDKECHDDIPDADALALWAAREYYGSTVDFEQEDFDPRKFYGVEGVEDEEEKEKIRAKMYAENEKRARELIRKAGLDYDDD